MNWNIDKRLLEAHAASGESAVILCTNHDITLCGCFYCESLFFSSEVDLPPYFEDSDHAALCPYCAKDAVLPETPEFPLSADFLKEMRFAFFGEYENPKAQGYDPFPFISDTESLNRRDTRKIMNVIARIGCKVCVQRKECYVAAGKPPQRGFRCEFEVDTAKLTRAIHKGLE